MGVKYSFIIVSDGVNRLFCKEVWQDEENRYWVEYNIHIWLVKIVRYIVMRSIIEQIKSVLFTQIPKDNSNEGLYYQLIIQMGLWFLMKLKKGMKWCMSNQCMTQTALLQIFSMHTRLLWKLLTWSHFTNIINYCLTHICF